MDQSFSSVELNVSSRNRAQAERDRPVSLSSELTFKKPLIKIIITQEP